MTLHAPADGLHDPAVHGRRDRKKQATRQALRSAALELVAERGFAHVTIEDITEAVDVAPRTFFNYFPSKVAAVIGADPDRMEHMAASLRTRPASESALAALSAVIVDDATAIDEELDALGESREIWFRRLNTIRKDEDLLGPYVAHVAEIERALAGALAARLRTDPGRDPYPALVTATAFAAARTAAFVWCAHGGTEPLARLTAAALLGLAGGLADDGVFRSAHGRGRKVIDEPGKAGPR